MASSSLPNELLEIIFSSIHAKTSAPTHESQTTFSSLCLVSKQFLPLARSYLYFRPICPSSTSTWERALSLASSLSSPLGRLVVSLEGVVDFVCKVGQLDEPASPIPFQLRGYTMDFSLYYRLLQSCPFLVAVDLLFSSAKHLSKLLEALTTAAATTLETVNFTNSEYSSAYCLSVQLVEGALQQARLGKIRHVTLNNISFPGGRSLVPSTSSALRTLRILTPNYYVLGLWKTIFPSDSSSLESVSLLFLDYDALDLSWLLSYLPSSLRHLSLSRSFPASRLYLENYTSNRIDSDPLPSFSRLTSLTKLELRGFYPGPSLNTLATLSSFSPRLEEIDFTGSRWDSVPGSSTEVVGDSIPGIIEPQECLAQLVKLPKLVRVHLGSLPTTNGRLWAGVKEAMGERGVVLDWNLCHGG